MVAMLHARNNTILFLWDKMFILMQNIFIVPSMQHAKPPCKTSIVLELVPLRGKKTFYMGVPPGGRAF